MIDLLPIALRVHTELAKPVKEKRFGRSRTTILRWGRLVLILDTETSIDAVQRLSFGSARLCVWRDDHTLECVREYIFYADDLEKLDPEGFSILQNYFRHLREPRKCELVSRKEFVDKVLWIAFKSDVLIVGFNLPFDLSRLAIGWTEARGRFTNGFSFLFWATVDSKTRTRCENRFRPRVRVKHIDSKRALTDAAKSGKDRIRVGFLDLRTLSYALTEQSHSLESACRAFSVAHPKQAAKQHGRIDEEYIAYNRRDVLATQELLEKLREEYDRHPIELSPVNALSSASIAKAYHRTMGITPPAKKFRKIPLEVLAASMMAYYGGRAECLIRNLICPVVYCDFLSMYPTVNSLMSLGQILTAASLSVVDATKEVQRFLDEVTFDRCFERTTWENLNFIAFIEPQGDILPVRAPYADGGRAYNIAVNPLTCPFPVPFTGPDLVAAKILSGKSPLVTKAWRLLPRGTQSGLQQVKLRGEVRIDPTRDDFFCKVVEQRKALKDSQSITPEERKRLVQFLKILANSGSYGIFAQLDRIDAPEGKKEELTVYGLDGPFIASNKAIERPGEFYFPPLAAQITAGARLMLALLETCVAKENGDYAFCDTDSMAILLPFEKVQEIVKRFAALNPYDRKVVQGSILKIENENFDPKTREPRQLWCYAIAAKRHVLFNRNQKGEIQIRKYTEHGLGHLRNPIDPADDSQDWIAQIWERIVCAKSDRPEWMNRPAVSRIGATTPELVRRLRNPRKPKRYADQVKPMGFLLAAHVAPLQVPNGRSQFQLIGPFEPNPRRWLSMIWTDSYSGEEYAVTTAGCTNGSIVRVRTYGDVIEAFYHHPEPKSLGADGQPCGPATIGKLSRRPVFAMYPIYVGKESNRIEEVEQGTIHDWDEVRTEYHDPKSNPWRTIVVPVLKTMNRREIATRAGISRRHVIRLLNLEQMPSPELRDRLSELAGVHARKELGTQATDDDLVACAIYLQKIPRKNTNILTDF